MHSPNKISVFAADEQKRRTGRTTRMLTAAFNQAQAGKSVVVFGNDLAHIKSMQLMLEAIAKGLAPRARAWKNRIYLLPFRDAGFHRYDWATHTFTDTKLLCYVDHYALQYQLRMVRHYLESTRQIDDVPSWMANTAKALTSLGRKVYMITDYESTAAAIKNSVDDYMQHLSVESGETLGNINWLDLTLDRAHHNCQLLFDPRTVEARFAGALKAVNLWDEEA
jgi:hypothetical protein